MKSGRTQVEIIALYEELGSYRAVGALMGCDDGRVVDDRLDDREARGYEQPASRLLKCPGAPEVTLSTASSAVARSGL